MMSQLSNPASSNRGILLRFFLGSLLGILVLALAIGVLLANNPPSWLVKDVLVQAIQDSTQQNLTVNGKAHLKLYPRIRLSLNDITLSDPKSGPLAEPLLKASRVDIDINVTDYWGRQIEIPKITLTSPLITIKPGAPILVLAAEGKVDVGLPQAIEIKNGHIDIVGHPPQKPVSLEDVSAVITRDSEGKVLEFEGQLTAFEKPLSMKGTLADMIALADGAVSPFDVDLKGDSFKASLIGELATQPVGQFKGKLIASTSALGTLLSWGGIDSSQYDFGETASLDASVVSSMRRITLEPAKLKLDSLDADVTADLSLEQERPALTASLKTDSLDINKLLPAAHPPLSMTRNESLEFPILPSAWDNLIEQAKGFQPGQGTVTAAALAPSNKWDTTPFKEIKLPPLDLDLSINAKEIAYGRQPLKNGKVVLKTRQRRLEIAINHLDLKQGTVHGRVELEFERGNLKSAMNLQLDNLQLEELLTQWAGRRVMKGTASGKLNVTGNGGNMRALVGSLAGTVSILAKRGEIIGIDLKKAVYDLGKPQTYNPRRRTKFDKIKGSFKIRSGVLHSADNLMLYGPQVYISSKGSYGLISQHIDHRFNLTLKPPPIYFPIPLRILGNIKKPKVSWDIFRAVATTSRLATPFSIAPRDKRMPLETRHEIEELLLPEERRQGRVPLSNEAREFLKTLLQTR